jgi:hypothetical protein
MSMRRDDDDKYKELERQAGLNSEPIHLQDVGCYDHDIIGCGVWPRR